MIRAAALLLLMLLSATQASADGEVTPLFRDDAVLRITFEGPIRRLVRTMEADEPELHDAVMTVLGTGERHPVKLRARGNFRRDRSNCRFPPLRVVIPGNPTEEELFDKQGSIKLVTHCRDRRNYTQYVLAEYLAYRLYNLVTDESLRVRLADISYINTGNGREVARQLGFFIEDIDDLARRLDMEEVEVPGVDRDQLAAGAAARYAVFQYMIGNLDWSVLAGPEGEDCCHNTKLVGADEDAGTALVPVPYDFDHAGIVDASYAKPPEKLRVRSVRTRRYRGFCAVNAEALETIAKLRAIRPAIYNEVAAIPGLDERKRGVITAYLDSFYEDIRDDDAVERHLFARCR